MTLHNFPQNMLSKALLTTGRAPLGRVVQTRLLSSGKDMGDVIGIDLGTTNSCVAIMEGEECRTQQFTESTVFPMTVTTYVK